MCRLSPGSGRQGVSFKFSPVEICGEHLLPRSLPNISLKCAESSCEDACLCLPFPPAFICPYVSVVPTLQGPCEKEDLTCASVLLVSETKEKD